MQAARVHEYLSEQFKDLLSSGQADLDSLALHEEQWPADLTTRSRAEWLLTASLAFTRAEETARIAGEMCPTTRYGTWRSRQTLAHGFLAAATRRLLALASEPTPAL